MPPGPPRLLTDEMEPAAPSPGHTPRSSVREARAQVRGAWLSGRRHPRHARAGGSRAPAQASGASAGHCGSERLPRLQAERTENDSGLRCGREAPSRSPSLSFRVGAAGVLPGSLTGLRGARQDRLPEKCRGFSFPLSSRNLRRPGRSTGKAGPCGAGSARWQGDNAHSSLPPPPCT